MVVPIKQFSVALFPSFTDRCLLPIIKAVRSDNSILLLVDWKLVVCLETKTC